VGDNYIDVLGMELVVGRNFDPGIDSDVDAAVLVNEAMVLHMGWSEPLGQRVTPAATPVDASVIGVIKDFHFQGLHQELGPLVLMQTRFNDAETFNNNDLVLQPRNLIIDIAPGTILQTLRLIDETWQLFDPSHPLEIEFLDESLNQLYLSEQHQVNLISGLALILVLINCLGLFGLSAFSVQQKTREIGVRKVLGASASRIIFMLIKSVIPIVATASVFAWLIAFLIANRWLESFYYHGEISIVVLLIATLATAGLAFGTLVSQSFRTAQANPVEALRYE